MTKQFRFSVDISKSVSKENGDFFIEGYASTDGLDRTYEMITLSALKYALPDFIERGKTAFFNHDYDRAVGRVDAAEVDDHGLKVKIYISSWEKELRHKISEGVINKFSIGAKMVEGRKLSPAEFHREFPELPRPPKAVLIYDKLNLYEVSIVGLPANAEADFVHKSLAASIKEELFADELAPVVKADKDSKLHNEEEVVENIKPEPTEQAPEIVNVEKTEGKTEPTATPVTSEVAAVVPEVQKEATPAPAPAPADVTTITSEASSSSTRVITNSADTYKVDTVTVDQNSQEIVHPSGVKETRQEVNLNIMTYTWEEVQAIEQKYLQQLKEKDAEIVTLKEEVSNVKKTLQPIPATLEVVADQNKPIMEKLDELTKRLTDLEAKAVEVKVSTKKSSPMPVVTEPTPTVVKSVDEQFLDVLKRADRQ